MIQRLIQQIIYDYHSKSLLYPRISYTTPLRIHLPFHNSITHTNLTDHPLRNKYLYLDCQNQIPTSIPVPLAYNPKDKGRKAHSPLGTSYLESLLATHPFVSPCPVSRPSFSRLDFRRHLHRKISSDGGPVTSRVTSAMMVALDQAILVFGW